MKAIYCTSYGPPEVLQMTEVPVPEPKANELLVRVVATAVNSGDVRVRGLVVDGFLRILMRFVLGFSKPRKPVLGTVFSGVVAQCGHDVTQFSEGDEVYGLTGFSFGTYTEFLTIKETGNVTFKPANAGFDEAAAVLFGGQTAIYFLEKAGLNKRDNAEVLIIGGTGSVGTSAIQIAKHYKARITTVCSSHGEELCRRLGADEIIAYDREDFRKSEKKYDVIFDAVGVTKPKECRHLLADGGVYKSVGGLEVAGESREQLEFIKQLFENHELDAVIDKTFQLDEVVEAHRYVDTGRKKGNVVLSVG